MLQQKHDEKWLPVSYASRSTTPAEQNYCPIELETLSIVFACNKFHQFIYGRKFLIENDHKPLRQIFKKSITKSPPRIQRFLLALQKYEFEVIYIPGRESVIADALSRAYITDSEQEISDTEMDKYIHTIIKQYPMSDQKLNIYRDETGKDTTLKMLMKYATSTWPEKNGRATHNSTIYASPR